mmetsp:Transcript_13910/g.22713  ORF Transcript_13910/g.22713 Transcript_13910/m.22713 type:complete len:261 (+) Transcript_13910:163-945(+)|eukprot:CAMPEP_0203800362 /NCGR_PEP_ID=MMETSP0100_2-20121128/10493_1 /ASSEMBLY_ACC=CAM_ASM_000210 /TAXON_ID=96639 /ORGANISM=" , Strain NY0313808BC1" /LENGTH=260 /DNA_ID=CAMNT_0050706473 /DNA_START=118 /DNA_END=900 /DNA_ORIENTATION=+
MDAAATAAKKLTAVVSKKGKRKFITELPSARPLTAFFRPGVCKRTSGGTISKQIRRAGCVPGVLYGGGSKANDHLLMVEERLIRQEMKSRGKCFENTLYQLQFPENGSKHLAVPRQTQIQVVTHAPIAVNFLRYCPVKGAKLPIPFEFVDVDTSPGVKRGGDVNYILWEAYCHVKGETIPETIEVSLKNADVGDRIKWSDLDIPENVRLLPIPSQKGLDPVILSIMGKSSLRKAANDERKLRKELEAQKAQEEQEAKVEN